MENSKVNDKIKFFENINNKVKLKEKEIMDEVYNKKHKTEIIIDNENKFRCPTCNISFKSEHELNNHYLLIHNDLSDSEDLIDIPASINGQYKCPLCNNMYATENMLGEHFITNHNNYTSFSDLDDNIINGGFPGFDILIHINMIKLPNKNKTNIIIKTEKQCPVCYKIYKLKKNIYIGKKNNNLDYNSDTCIYDFDIYKKHKNYREYHSDSEFDILPINTPTSITDNILIDKYDEYSTTSRLPIILKCCKMNLCKECLENYIKQTNKIICPFCKKDHTRNDLDYITIIEPSNITDESKWIDWWWKHLDIFY